jgi:hypothetical protein
MKIDEMRMKNANVVDRADVTGVGDIIGDGSGGVFVCDGGVEDIENVQ